MSLNRSAPLATISPKIGNLASGNHRMPSICILPSGSTSCKLTGRAFLWHSGIMIARSRPSWINMIRAKSKGAAPPMGTLLSPPVRCSPHGYAGTFASGFFFDLPPTKAEGSCSPRSPWRPSARGAWSQWPPAACTPGRCPASASILGSFHGPKRGHPVFGG